MLTKLPYQTEDCSYYTTFWQNPQGALVNLTNTTNFAP